MPFPLEMRRFPPFNFSINPLKNHYILKKNRSKIPARINSQFTKKKSNGNWDKDNLNSIREIKIKLNIYLVLQINGQCSYFFRHKTNHNWKNWISSYYKEVKCNSWYFKWTNSLKTVELHEGIEKYDIRYVVNKIVSQKLKIQQIHFNITTSSFFHRKYTYQKYISSSRKVYYKNIFSILIILFISICKCLSKKIVIICS